MKSVNFFVGQILGFSIFRAIGIMPRLVITCGAVAAALFAGHGVAVPKPVAGRNEALGVHAPLVPHAAIARTRAGAIGKRAIGFVFDAFTRTAREP